jgi:signal peptidase I
MGDHRTASRDSREFGMVKSSEVIGRAWLRFWPLNTLGILQTPTYPELNGTSSNSNSN